jgi:hypothetical protein
MNLAREMVCADIRRKEMEEIAGGKPGQLPRIKKPGINSQLLQRFRRLQNLCPRPSTKN